MPSAATSSRVRKIGLFMGDVHFESKCGHSVTEGAAMPPRRASATFASSAVKARHARALRNFRWVRSTFHRSARSPCLTLLRATGASALLSRYCPPFQTLDFPPHRAAFRAAFSLRDLSTFAALAAASGCCAALLL